VLVVGGSEEFVGAPFLAGIAALRSGAESVIVMAPEKVAWAINALSPDLITKKLKGGYLAPRHKATIMRHLKNADILLLGNGATTRPETASVMRSLMRWPGLKVVDADALKVLRNNAVSNAILTPNEGEWQIIASRNDIRKLLKKNVVIIKKGFPSLILSAKKTFRMPITNRGLQKAGTGDVLAGLCAGYLAQGLSLRNAAKKAAETGNRIADILTKRKKGYFFLASDIVGELRKAQKARGGRRR
jgi:NAD(P)H-hydrate epimerase